MEHKATRHEIRTTLWPQRLVNVRRSLNRSSRVIVLLGLFALTGCAMWVKYDQSARAASLSLQEWRTWFHPAYINSVLIAVMMMYALRQIRRTRQKLNPLGYPLLECIDVQRGVEVWRSTEPLTMRPVHVHLIQRDENKSTADNWDELRQAWLRRSEKRRRLFSPHVATLFDCGFGQGDSFYTVVEMPVGLRIDKLIAQHGPCPIDRTLHLLDQLAHAIDDAHQQGIYQLGLSARHVWIGQRASIADWVAVELFGYNHDQSAESSTSDDVAAFARIAVGICTGKWLEASATSEAMHDALHEHNIPDEIARHIVDMANIRNGTTASVYDLFRKIRDVYHGPMWTPDRATAWWAEHRHESGRS